MTNGIADNFLHHLYYRVPKSIMPVSECIDILKNYLISNMFYGVYVCKVQSSLEQKNFLQIYLSYPISLVKRRNSSLLSICVFTWKPFLRLSLKLRRVRVESGYNKASSIVICVPIERVVVACPEQTINASQPTIVIIFLSLNLRV
jgi:hypothetical protein